MQADLKTWASLAAEGVPVYGMSAITAVTAQNSARVAAVHYLPPDFVAAQIDAVLSDYGAAAIKTGFLGRVDIIEAVAERLAHYKTSGVFGKPLRSGPPVIVIDPVLVNHRGESMYGPEVAAAYRVLLFPLADLVTPNAAEAKLLLGISDWGVGERSKHPMPDPQSLINLSALAPRLLLKGLRQGDGLVDILLDGETAAQLPQPRVDTINTHGSGDTLSAAVCAYRAAGHDWLDAIRRAQAYTHAAIRRGAAWRLGAGHGPVGHGSDERRATSDE